MTALAGLALTAPAAAQDPLIAKDVELRSVRPEHIQLDALYRILNELYGRELRFEDGRKSRNVILGNGALLLNEEKGRLEPILAAIEKLDVATGPRAQDFTIGIFQPEHADVRVLGNLAMQLLNRTIPAASGGMQNSLSVADDRIVVRELDGAMGDVLAKLRTLDAALARDDVAPVEAMEYTPRSLSVQGVTQALQPFVQGSFGHQAALLQMVSERGVLVLRGRAADLEAARELLERVDRPAPQLMLSAFVLTGSDDGDGNASASLADALRELLPFRSYSIEAASVVRIAGNPMSSFTVDLVGAAKGLSQATYQVQGTIAAYDPEGQSLTFDNLSASRSGPGARQLFRTSSTIYGGEYAVLGVAGGEPTFLVLRLKPVRAPGAGARTAGNDGREPR
ncbi:MAG: hypothetical protein KDE27_32330 [Planctomycetes bacterium]|nr:hypothetical protein [Planctomycetota bacterium]